jgi:hypothetical protein
MLPRMRSWVAGGTLFILFLAVFSLYWWANTPPKRPSGVSSDAVFVWGPPVGLPAAKRGDWIMCWMDSSENADRCRIVDAGGWIRYEGVFVSYEGLTVSDVDLKIDSKKTNLAQERVGVSAADEESVGSGLTFVPLIYLRNGDVLIPKRGYQRGKGRLDELKRAHSP